MNTALTASIQGFKSQRFGLISEFLSDLHAGQGQ